MDIDGENTLDQSVKKLVRYALACEYSRIPISRTGIREKSQCYHISKLKLSLMHAKLV